MITHSRRAFLVFLFLLVDPSTAISWLVSNVLMTSSTIQLKQADIALTTSVSYGTQTAINECRHQFRFESWNCPEQAFHLSEKDIKNQGNVATKETPKSKRRVLKSSRSLKQLDVRQRQHSEEEVEEDDGHNQFHITNNFRPRLNKKRMAKIVNLNDSPNEDLIERHEVERRQSQRLPDWKHVRRPMTRETAFVHAITSAGIAYTLTKNCSSGDFPDCVCDAQLTRRQLGWEWGGCSDNFHFGSQVARHFLDTVEAGEDVRSMANRHNNEAGRIAVRKTMRSLCKCHGVSGSCAAKTCWRQISEFREVGNYLKSMYHQAHKVEHDVLDHSDNLLSNRIGRTSMNDKIPIKRFRRKSKKLRKRHLVFMEDSPDYCRRNTTAGLPGVLGRTCSTDPGNPKSKVKVETCKDLCERCGLKARRKVFEVPISCNCTFTWCCNVACKTCIIKRIEITCV